VKTPCEKRSARGARPGGHTHAITIHHAASKPGAWRLALLVAPLVLVLTTLWVPSVRAHGTPKPFPFWGNFAPEEATCQRVVGHAGALCATRRWAARQTCLAAQLRGEQCDTASTDAAIEAARIHALNLIDPHCSDRIAQALGFLGLFEVQGDLETFSQTFDDAMSSAVYGPVLEGGAVLTIEPETRRCVEAAADAATRMVHLAMKTQRSPLERIARRSVLPSEKDALLERAAARIQRARLPLARHLAARCPDAQFAAVYGRDINVFLDGIASRADCLAAALFVQDGILCPEPECGNGIREAGETCPDGQY